MTTLRDPAPITDEQLDRTWEDAPGVPGFFTTVDHKRIGIRYIVTAFFFFFSAGLLALFMRAQLAEPNAHVLSAETYNEFFTMHGTSMIFLFNTPVLAGFGNYLLPMQIGSRDMAFPRLNAFSYWIFLLSGVFLYSSFLVGHLPDGGWFAYTPLTSKAFSPGINLDFWGLGVVFVGISTTVGAVNFIVTTFKIRAPGMSLNRLPIFVWSMLVFSFMVIFAVPAVTVAAGLLELDRIFGTQFFNPAHGGSTLLYQHLFWFWGHPEVYILFVPATGMVSMIITAFSRRALAGYLWIVTALVSIGFISFGVWVHHMFATGMPPLALSFFSAVSLLITIPSGVQFFAWIATMWRGKVDLTTPMLFAIGFLLIFLLGGISGVMVAVLPFDWQVTDSYFVVAHFHYVLNGAVVFPIFGAIYFWLPKMTGRMLSERLGKISFWTMFVGFNVTFFPDAHPRLPRHAPPRVHVRFRARVGLAEHDREPRVGRVRRRHASHALQRLAQPQTRRAGRRGPVACGHPRVGHDLASPRLQLRCHPRRREPPPALGPAAADGRDVGGRRRDARARS